jgi:signal transduction histidine kinase
MTDIAVASEAGDRGEAEPSCRGLIVVRHAPAPIPSPLLVAAAPSPDDADRLRRELDAARSRHAAELADLRSQLLDVRKQASLGELVGTTTHEFNNALTTILNYARMGLRHRDQPTRDKALERILSAGTRAAKITASVLSMSRNRTTRFEPVDLVMLTEDVLVLLEREMMKYRVQVEREFAPVPRVSANPSQLQQVLLNLLVNARQAMASGGRLILRRTTRPPASLI